MDAAPARGTSPATGFRPHLTTAFVFAVMAVKGTVVPLKTNPTPRSAEPNLPEDVAGLDAVDERDTAVGCGDERRPRLEDENGVRVALGVERERPGDRQGRRANARPSRGPTSKPAEEPAVRRTQQVSTTLGRRVAATVPECGTRAPRPRGRRYPGPIRGGAGRPRRLSRRPQVPRSETRPGGPSPQSSTPTGPDPGCWREMLEPPLVLSEAPTFSSVGRPCRLLECHWDGR